MITVLAYYYKYVIENQHEINQYHKNLLKDPKRVSYPKLVFTTSQWHTNSPMHKNWQIISMKITKIGEA